MYVGCDGRLSLSVLSSASTLAISPPGMHVRTLYFVYVDLCGVQFIWCTVAAICSLSRCRCCEDGCCM